jgi:hypothetical protein
MKKIVSAAEDLAEAEEQKSILAMSQPMEV